MMLSYKKATRISKLKYCTCGVVHPILISNKSTNAFRTHMTTTTLVCTLFIGALRSSVFTEPRPMFGAPAVHTMTSPFPPAACTSIQAINYAAQWSCIVCCSWLRGWLVIIDFAWLKPIAGSTVWPFWSASALVATQCNLASSFREENLLFSMRCYNNRVISLWAKERWHSYLQSRLPRNVAINRTNGWATSTDSSIIQPIS